MSLKEGKIMNSKLSESSLDAIEDKDYDTERRIDQMLEDIKCLNPKLVTPRLEMINEIVSVLGDEDEQIVMNKLQELQTISTNLNQTISYLIDLHSLEFNHTLANINPFGGKLNEIHFRIKKLRNYNQECKKGIRKKTQELGGLSLRDAYFLEMKEGIQSIQDFNKQIELIDNYNSKENYVLAAITLNSLRNTIKEKSEMLLNYDLHTFLLDKYNERETALINNLERLILDFMFLKEDKTLENMINKFYKLFLEDFLIKAAKKNEQEGEFKVVNDINLIMDSSYFNSYLSFVYEQYFEKSEVNISQMNDLLKEYEETYLENIHMASIMEEFMENMTLNMSSSNICFLILLIQAYLKVSSFDKLSQLIQDKLQDELQNFIVNCLKLCKTADQSEAILQDNYFQYLSHCKERRFVHDILKVDIPSLFKLNLTICTMLSASSMILRNIVGYEIALGDYNIEKGLMSMECLCNLQYYLKTFLLVSFEYDKWVQTLFNAVDPSLVHLEEKQTLRFSVNKMPNHEGFLKDSEKRNLEFTKNIYEILQDYFLQDIFLVPIISRKFQNFQIFSTDFLMNKAPSKEGEGIYVVDVLNKFIISNYEMLTMQYTENVQNIIQKHLASKSSLLQKYVSHLLMFTPLYNPKITLQGLQEEHLPIERIESFVFFHLFVNIFKKVIHNAPQKFYAHLMNTFMLFLQKISQNTQEFFADEMRNTGYLDVFDETYYEFERDAFYMRNIKYTFLHAPIHKGQYFINYDDKIRIGIEKNILQFKIIIPPSKCLKDLSKIKLLYYIHENIGCLFRDIDFLFESSEQSSRSPGAKDLVDSSHFGNKVQNPFSDPNEEMEEIFGALSKYTDILHVIYKDTLICIKTHIINICATQLFQFGNSDFWANIPPKSPHISIIKVMREIIVLFNNLHKIISEEKLFYLFNFCERLICKTLRNSFNIFKRKRINKHGLQLLRTSFNYLIEKFMEMKIPSINSPDFTFHSNENEFNKTKFFIELLALNESEVVMKLRTSAFKFSFDEIELVLGLKTHLRDEFNEVKKNSVKKVITFTS